MAVTINVLDSLFLLNLKRVNPEEMFINNYLFRYWILKVKLVYRYACSYKQILVEDKKCGEKRTSNLPQTF